MPLDEVQEIYDKYIEETNKINKAQDNFFDVANQMVSEDIDDMFDINTTANKASTTKTAESFFENL